MQAFNTVYGVIMNDGRSLAKLGSALHSDPYKKPAQVPVLYIKPSNTLNSSGGSVALPSGVPALEVGATLGLVIGQKASRLTADNALNAVSGVVVAADLSVPHTSYYRPAIREKCFDGSLVLSEVYPYQDLSQLNLSTRVNGQEVDQRSFSDLTRSVAQLLVDVTEFMTLNAGDVLLMGVLYQAPQASAGQRVEVICEGLGQVSFDIGQTMHLVNQNQAMRMSSARQGRIVLDGKVCEVTPSADGRVQTDDGRVMAEDEVQWLPPVEVGTVFALGLNYADHAKELAFKAPEVPLVFLKGKNTIVGHNARTRRPADATYMHYECELAVVIGRTARNVRAEDAQDYVLGYTVANDYAIRDYLENYYRPNLRVKNRDHCTPLGPWLTAVSEVVDPMNLRLYTRVNGQSTQEGSTSDMIFSIATLIEYLSSIMTLSPGDVILTGTPEGLADVKAGDVIETEIEGLGILRNTIVDDKTYFGA